MRFVSLEVVPLREEGDEYQECEPHEAEFYSLFGEDEHGLMWCIGDFDTLGYAETIRDALRAS